MQQLLIWVVSAGLVGQLLVYLVAFVAVAFHYVARARAAGTGLSLGRFVRHLCPPELLRSRWTYADCLYYVADRVIGIAIYPIVGAFTVLCAGLVLAGLRQAVGTGPALPLNAFTLAAFLVLALLARDFISFYLHMMQHRIPLFWEFHKVHHAPETLIPMTGHRLHPLELCFNLAGDAVLFGILVGAFAWSSDAGLEVLILCSAGLQMLISMLTLSPLRHSHIDLRFGRFERFILSPAHHRLHHSVEPHHWDKNFAAIFPFWDKAWRTLFPPPPSDTYRLGLPDGVSVQYVSVGGSYMRPFRAVLHRARAEGWAMLRLGKLASMSGVDEALPRATASSGKPIEHLPSHLARE